MTERAALSVTEVLRQAKSALERIRVTVIGEVSELTDRSGYKAVYFSLCDGDSVLPCLMWRREFEAAGVTLTEGALVQVTGFLTVYQAKGRLQFQVRGLELAGEGALRMQVALLAKRLSAEGLMAAERKRELPELPARIGLVTSPRGKAVHDVIRTLKRRYPMGELVFAGVKVEGRDAAEAMVQGLRAVEEAGVDVVIFCRGGGSYEDLMPFNDERVARAVVGMSIPVVTGIGHEPDTSIADMVADLATSTPTAAAEAVAPSREELEARLRHASSGLGRGLAAAAGRLEHRLARVASRPVLSDPFAVLAPFAQRIDGAAAGLGRALPGRLERERLRVTAARRGLTSAGARLVERTSARVEALEDRLGDLSPLSILGRGYAICFDSAGRAVRTAHELRVGGHLDVRFSEGRAGCAVETVELEDA